MSEGDPVYRRVARCIRRMGSKHTGEMLGAVIALQRELKKDGRSCEDLAAWIETWVQTDAALSDMAVAVADEIEDEADAEERALVEAAAARETLPDDGEG